MEGVSGKKRSRYESDESEFGSPEVKRLRHDLFDVLDESDDVCTTSQDLDSFMKSFEEEISASGASSPAVAVVDLTSESCESSESGESQPELGYLLEASDYELGIPPSVTSPSEVDNRVETESVRVLSDSDGLTELWGFNDQISGYDSFEFGFGDVDAFNNNTNAEYVALDGLFDYSDLGFGSSDYPWRPETLPAQ
ncbi:hypothetical protein RJ639_016815 [Escallonia herrerae]|uniref:Uncharacterized protein n=1 Tax=Escallonia herrerae TaxID=1293975 RepID=A0AA88VDA6_9ASTE|nr:hypothetical protein RJ639_016815 [Escallonia herrerae]